MWVCGRTRVCCSDKRFVDKSRLSVDKYPIMWRSHLKLSVLQGTRPPYVDAEKRILQYMDWALALRISQMRVWMSSPNLLHREGVFR